ncbi:unnamed protein product [Kuraishia capsulata CBS 1993]|uniref:Uncharacterized protein n=1 Tax=Kuraishia capsulata CBS 1993 TaxID=1382522 RepID=W6MNU2_9ASCO|nr:uncharacterized protein KUCA_T00004321001 [Kuraishia capsulata CBS 1993]CDK28339.1 unnamed protein product [Kuraishia capsulata CBS 1993]
MRPNVCSVRRMLHSRLLSSQKPPTYFGSLSNPPKTLDELRNDATSTKPEITSEQYGSSSAYQPSTSHSDHYESTNRILRFKDITMSISLIAVTCLLFDHIFAAREADKQMDELTRKYQKNLRSLQLNFQQQNRQRNLQTLSERKKMLQREMKMGLHIALLREQLIENDIQPDFENHVKGDNALAVVPQTLWVSDDSSKYVFLSVFEWQ